MGEGQSKLDGSGNTPITPSHKQVSQSAVPVRKDSISKKKKKKHFPRIRDRRKSKEVSQSSQLSSDGSSEKFNESSEWEQKLRDSNLLRREKVLELAKQQADVEQVSKREKNTNSTLPQYDLNTTQSPRIAAQTQQVSNKRKHKKQTKQNTKPKSLFHQY